MRGPGTRVDTLSLCAVGRDEAPYVVEWAHHHLAIGFERIYYYDNAWNIHYPSPKAEGSRYFNCVKKLPLDKESIQYVLQEMLEHAQ